MRRSAAPGRTGGRLYRRRCAWASGASTPNERVDLAVVAGRCCAVCITHSITGWSARFDGWRCIGAESGAKLGLQRTVAYVSPDRRESLPAQT